METGCAHEIISAYDKKTFAYGKGFRRITGLSGRLDSNQRPPTPEAGALTGLRYTPN